MRGPCIICNKPGVHSFPQEESTRSQWMLALKPNETRRPGWRLRKYSSICSDHFKPSDFISSPPMFDGDVEKRRLKRKAVPSVFPWTVTSNIAYKAITLPATESVKFNPASVSTTYSKTVLKFAFAEEIHYTALDAETPTEDPLHIDSDHQSFAGISNDNDDIGFIMNVETAEGHFHNSLDTCKITTLKTENKYVQTDDNNNNPVSKESLGFNSLSYKNNDKSVHFYTGLETFQKVQLVFNSIGGSVNDLKYFYGPPPKSMDPFEQFFMTLIILRRHKTFEELSMMYQISIKQVSNIFVTWIRLMSLQWRNLNLWVNRSTVKAYMPLDFYDKYPNTRAVFDATECPVKKPSLPTAQQVTFSTYKNRNTVKVLIGIAPSGLITYVSPCYGGSATDRQIIERSDILDKFQYNDEIMVDKGLNVQDIFISYGVKVNMPEFFKKGNQIGSDTLKENRKVASKRVHIERVIGALKTYKILTQPMNRTETLLASDIVFNCAMLVNFRTNIVGKNA